MDPSSESPASRPRARPPRLSRSGRALRLTLVVGVLAGCGIRYDAPDTPDESSTVGGDDPQLVFWQSLEALCGQAFEGRVVENVPPDASFDGRHLVMHVRSCDLAEIRIPFFVGEDRSRTWVITPTAAGLRLQHDHLHEDGTEDPISRYGGESRGRGTAESQEFHADAFTGDLVPAAGANVWTLEVHPGRMFAYALRREDSDRRFRVEFDLTTPIPEPPPPW